MSMRVAADMHQAVTCSGQWLTDSFYFLSKGDILCLYESAFILLRQYFHQNHWNYPLNLLLGSDLDAESQRLVTLIFTHDLFIHQSNTTHYIFCCSYMKLKLMVVQNFYLSNFCQLCTSFSYLSYKLQGKKFLRKDTNEMLSPNIDVYRRLLL